MATRNSQLRVPSGRRTSPPAIDLSIIIVSWNVWDLLRACLQSIERASRPATEGGSWRRFGLAGQDHTLEVIVVDNASRDATVDGLRARFPWVQVIANTENLGFTRGNNRGYAESRGQFVFFLNPDTEIISTQAIEAASDTHNSLWMLYSTIHADLQVGMVGPQLRYGDGSVQNNRRRFPDRLTGFFESTWLSRAWPQNPWSRRLHMSDWPATIQHDVDWLVGAAMLARRTTLEAVRGDAPGPFDETFFMYSEELDLCRRIKGAGWRIVYVPTATVVHYEGRSSEQVVAQRHINFNTSKVRYYRKYFGVRWADWLRRYLLLEFRLQCAIEWVKLQIGHKRALRNNRLLAYRAVIRSQLKPTEPAA